MTTWSQPHTVKSNARRAAKKLGLDPTSVVSFVKAGKTLYRFPMPEAGKAKPPTKSERAVTRMKKVQAATQARIEKGLAERAAAKKTKTKAPKAAKPAAPTDASSSPTRGNGGEKFVAVAALLRKPGGASMNEVTKATGWKPHSARARISVDVSKLLAKGEEIVRRREEGQSWYSIVKSTQMDLPIEDAKAA